MSQDGRITRSVALLAIGGVIGPLAFVTTWVVAGRVAPGYSPVRDAISDLAATHASTRVAMTLGFVVFGVGVIAFGLALRGAGAGPAWISVVATAGFTLAVAATPLGGRPATSCTECSRHSATSRSRRRPSWAPGTFATTAGAGWVRYSRATGVLAAACLLASAFGPRARALPTRRVDDR